MRTYPRQVKAVVAVTALLAAAACTSDGSEGEDDGSSAPDQVTYMTSFANFGRDSYALVAKEKGYFEEVGIDVTIEPGAGGENLSILSGGEADFVVADIISAMFTVTEDDDAGITGVAAVHQNTLTGLMTLEGNGVTTPADLEGKTIGDFSGSVNVTLFDTYADLAGIDASKVNFEFAPPPDLPGLLATDTVDVIGQFAVGEPLIEGAAGGERAAVSLPYSEYLTDLYGITLFTSTELADEDPDLVQRFTSALMRGLEYALDNPDEAGQMLAESDETADAEVASTELQLMDPFARPLSPGEPFGTIDEERLARSIAVLEAAGSIEPGLTPDQLVDFDLVPTPES